MTSLSARSLNPGKLLLMLWKTKKKKTGPRTSTCRSYRYLSNAPITQPLHQSCRINVNVLIKLLDAIKTQKESFIIFPLNAIFLSRALKDISLQTHSRQKFFRISSIRLPFVKLKVVLIKCG